MKPAMSAPQTWLGVVAAGLLWFSVYEFSGRTSIAAIAATGTRREQAAAAAAYGSIRPIVFAIVWTLLYVANSAATFLYWRDGGSLSLYWAALGLILGNVFVNKAWSAIFADARSPRLALVDILLNLGLAIALLVVVAIDAATVTWWPFALFVPYVIWLVVATVLNYRYICALGRPLPSSGGSSRYGSPPSLPRSVRE